MRFFLKGRLGSVVTLLVILNFLSYLVFYIPNYVMKSEPTAVLYFRLLFCELISFLLIPIATTFIYYLKQAGRSCAHLLLPTLALAATRCVINLPYYYLYETALGNDWIESTLLSFGINAIILTLDFLFIYGLALGIDALTRRLSRGSAGQPLDGVRGSVVALDTPEYKSLLLVSAAVFLLNVFSEIVDVVDHLTNYGSFRTSELTFIICKFAFLIILFAFSYILQTTLYNSYRKAYANDRNN